MGDEKRATTPLAPGKCTPTTPTPGEAQPVGLAVQEVLARTFERHAAVLDEREREWRRREQAAELARRARLLDELIASAGKRFSAATFENYQTPHPGQAAVLAAVKRYAANLLRHIAAGEGLLCVGTTGTGKDHLLVALARDAILRHGIAVRYVSGAELFRTARDAMEHGLEGRALAPLRTAPVLVLSDPLPPVGALGPWQTQTLYDLLDARWSAQRPVWCSANVASAAEAAERMGAALVSRLQDRAIVLRFNWPSWRKPQGVPQ